MKSILPKSPICLAIVILCFTHIIKADDTIPNINLNEVVVEAKRGWVEDNKAVFIPTKQEKNLSNSPESLISAMHLPMIRETNGVLTGMSGEPIVYFINGIRADNIDIATFWPKNAKRVEYMENPADPKFEGAKTVINFIMTEYALGGVSRVNLFQRIPNNGIYTVSSKLAYKKMTYGVSFTGGYSRDHRSTSVGEETYSDLYFDDKFYESITRVNSGKQCNRNEYTNVSVNARYAGEKFLATHKAAFMWDRNPGSESFFSDTWLPNLFKSNISSNKISSITRSPQLSGRYYTSLSDKWSISGNWSYSYANNNLNTLNITGDATPLENKSSENVHSLQVALQPALYVSRKLSFQMLIESEFDWFSSEYAGTVTSLSKQQRNETQASLSINWLPSANLRATLRPGLSASYSKIGSLKANHTVRPTAGGSIYWVAGNKFAVSGNLYFYMRTPDANVSNDVIIQQTPLLWMAGNPNLKNLTSWDTYLNATWLTSKWLTMSGGFGYVKTYNDFIQTYEMASPDKGGIITTDINAEPIDHMRANVNIVCNLFNNNMSVTLTPEWHYTKTRGDYASSFGHVSLSGSVDYSVRNCRFEISHYGKKKGIDLAGMERFRIPDNWNFKFTYGNGDLFLSVKVEDIFNTYKESSRIITAPHYRSDITSFTTGRNLSVSVTYTFGYGKTIDRNINISGADGVKTSILGNN